MVDESNNGWAEYKKAVLWRFDNLEKRIDAIDYKLWGVVAGMVLVAVKIAFDMIAR